jgi:phosphate transport system permease protein
MAGTYIAEYSRGSRFAQAVQFINDVLLSAPSIVIGLFIAEVMVVQSRHFSGWAGSVALGIIVVPVVVRTTVDMLGLVPNTLREAAAALGTPKWKIVTMVCYRAAGQGMLTGIMLAVARISGETAPLLFTAFGDDKLKWNMNEPISSLPLAINTFVIEGTPESSRLAWGGALLITVTILSLNITARSLANAGSSKR